MHMSRWLPDETIDIKHLFKPGIVKKKRNRIKQENKMPDKCWDRTVCIVFVDKQFDEVSPDKSSLVIPGLRTSFFACVSVCVCGRNRVGR